MDERLLDFGYEMNLLVNANIGEDAACQGHVSVTGLFHPIPDVIAGDILRNDLDACCQIFSCPSVGQTFTNLFESALYGWLSARLLRNRPGG